jgi:hypothetical protein
MKLVWLLFSLFLIQEQVPFKPKDQFEIGLDFKFKQRPPHDSNIVRLSETAADREKNSTSLLPYIYLNVKVLKLREEEVRLRVENNKGENLWSRKAEEGMSTKLDLGFTDDIKDRVASHEYIVYFLTKEKKRLSRIVIFFDKDGTYLVNEERRGKL